MAPPRRNFPEDKSVLDREESEELDSRRQKWVAFTRKLSKKPRRKSFRKAQSVEKPMVDHPYDQKLMQLLDSERMTAKWDGVGPTMVSSQDGWKKMADTVRFDPVHTFTGDKVIKHLPRTIRTGQCVFKKEPKAEEAVEDEDAEGDH